LKSAVKVGKSRGKTTKVNVAGLTFDQVPGGFDGESIHLHYLPPGLPSPQRAVAGVASPLRLPCTERRKRIAHDQPH